MKKINIPIYCIYLLMSDVLMRQAFTGDDNLKFFDEKFLENKSSYILQCILATISVFWILFVLDIISDGIVIASLGASSFIAFTMPNTQASRLRFLIGGYCVGIFTGTLFNILQYASGYFIYLPKDHNSSIALFGALAIGCAIFLMVITNTEHPPAAALSLSIVLGGLHLRTIIVALIGITVLCVIKKILGRYLINLL